MVCEDEVREYLAKPECLRTIMTTQRHADPCVRLSAIATITELAKHSKFPYLFVARNDANHLQAIYVQSS